MKKVAFYTLGCKVNQYETEAVTGLFSKEGYETVGFEEKADVYIINTCTVTSMSDRKSRQVIRKAKKNNEDAIIVVMGCYAQTKAEEVEKIPGVNLILGTQDRNNIIEYIKEVEHGTTQVNMVEDIMNVRAFEEMNVDTYEGRTRAFLKIQEGCNQFCSYCIIPYARGPVRSRDPENVVSEVKRLAQAGFKEIVLTGIHIASYGKDIKTTSLLDLMVKVHRIDGIERIRLGSIEPTLITQEFVGTVEGLEKICPHYHVSLQSGCDETLKRMNRKYTTREYKNAIGLLRKHIQDVALTTDVMVGFPGETEEEFDQSYQFLEEIAFSKIHVFKYSPRKGTPAAQFLHPVPVQEKEERSNRLLALSALHTMAFNHQYIGKVLPVLFEQEVKEKKGYVEGLTPNYIRVLCKGDLDIKGTILNVQLGQPLEDWMTGEIID